MPAFPGLWTAAGAAVVAHADRCPPRGSAASASTSCAFGRECADPPPPPPGRLRTCADRRCVGCELVGISGIFKAIAHLFARPLGKARETCCTKSASRPLLAASLLALCVTVTLASFLVSPAHAQSAETSVTIAADRKHVPEGRSATFTLTRNGDISSPLTVRVYSQETDKLEVALDHQITFAAGSDAAKLSVPVEEDGTEDDGDRLRDRLRATVYAAADSAYTVGEPSSATVEIIDDLPAVTVESKDRFTLEKVRARFVLHRTGPLDDDLAVHFRVTQDGDFLEGVPPNSAVIPGGRNALSVDLPLEDDNVSEPNGTVTLTLTAPADAHYQAGDPTSATVPVRDNDTPDVDITADQAVAPKGRSASFTLTRTGGAQTSLTVKVLSQESFPSLPEVQHSVTFEPGATSAKLSVPVTPKDDAPIQDSLLARLSVDATSGYTAGRRPLFPNAARVVIIDSPQVVTIAPKHATRSEGTSAVFTVTRSGERPSTGNLTVPLTVTETGGYVDGTPPAAVVIPNGSTSAEFSVILEDNPNREGNGSVTATLSPPPDAIYDVGTDSSATVTVTDNDPPGLRPLVDIAANRSRVPPGATVHFTLTRTDSDITVPLTVYLYTEETDNIGETRVDHAVIFEAGSDTIELGVMISADDTEGSGRYLRAEMKSSPYYRSGIVHGQFYIIPNEARVTIEDAPETVTIAAVDSVRSEAHGTAEFTVTRSWPPDDDRTVRVAVTHTGAFLDGTPPAEVVIPQGSRSAVLAIALDDDLTHEDAGSVTAAVSPPAGAHYRAGTPGTATVTLHDDDVPAISIRADQPRTPEGRSAAFTLTRSGATTGDLTVRVYTVEPNRALNADGSNPSAAHRNVVFGAGSDTAVLRVPVAGDGMAETGDLLVAEVSPPAAPAPYKRGEPYRAEVEIADEAETVTIEARHRSRLESDGSALFTVTRSGEPNEDLKVQVSVTHTGEFVDGTPPTSVVILRHSRSAELSVVLVDDETAEDNGSVTAAVSPPAAAYYTAGSPGSATVTLIDDDSPAVSINDVRVNESDGSATLTVTLKPATEHTVTMNWTTVDGTAKDAVDLTPGPHFTAIADYTAARSSLAFQPGDTSKTITLTLGDKGNLGVDEDLEQFTVELSGVSGARLADGSGAVTIEDNDPRAELRFSRTDTAATEGGGPVELTVSMAKTRSTERLVSIDWETADGTAKAGEDYAAGSGTLTYQPGEYAKTISLGLIKDDKVHEAEETFKVQLLNPRSSVVVGGDYATVTVADDDNFGVLVEPASLKVYRTTSETYTVRLTAAPTADLRVRIDYSSDSRLSVSPGHLTFTRQNWGTPQKVTVTVAYNASLGSIRLTHNPDNTGNYRTAPNTVLTVEVLGRPRVSIAPAVGTAPENGEAAFTLTRTGDSGVALNVRVDSVEPNRPGVGSSQDNPSSRTADVPMPAGETSVTFTVPVLDDGIPETNDRIEASIQARDGDKYRLGVSGSATVIIIDDDIEMITVAADRSSLSEADGAATFTLTRLAAEAELTVSVLVTQNGDFISGAKPSRVTFPEGSLTAEVTVPLDNDEIDEHHGSVRVEVSVPEDAEYRAGSPGVAEVRVSDDDDPIVAIASADTIVDEGENAVFTLHRSGAAVIPLTVYLEVFWQRALGGAHLIRRLVPVTFGAGSNTATYILSTEDDDVNLSDLLVRVQFMSNQPFAIVGSPDTAEVRIRDDDPARITIEADHQTRVEGQDVTFTLTRYSNIDAELTIPVTVTEVGSFIQGAAPVSFTFPADQQTATFSVPTEDDDWHEADGSVTVTVGERDDYIIVGDASVGPVAVTDNDLAQVVWITRDNSDVVEGSHPKFLIHRWEKVEGLGQFPGGYSAAVNRGPLTVNLNVSHTGDLLKKPLPTTFTISANKSFGILQVAVDDDDLFETDGSVTVEIATGENYAPYYDSFTSQTALISNDDAQQVISVSRLEEYVVEGSPIVFVVTRHDLVDGQKVLNTSRGNLPVNFSLATQGTFLTAGRPVSQTMLRGSTTMQVVERTVDDSQEENAGWAKLTLQPGGDQYLIDETASSATIEIQDNEPPRVSIYPSPGSLGSYEGGVGAVDEGEGFTTVVRRRYGNMRAPLTVYLKQSSTQCVDNVQMPRFVSPLPASVDDKAVEVTLDAGSASARYTLHNTLEDTIYECDMLIATEVAANPSQTSGTPAYRPARAEDPYVDSEGRSHVGSFVVRLEDDDPAPSFVLASEQRQSEGAGEFLVAFEFINHPSAWPTEQDIAIRWGRHASEGHLYAEDEALPGLDHGGFAAGGSSIALEYRLNVVDDRLDEHDEKFIVYTSVYGKFPSSPGPIETAGGLVDFLRLQRERQGIQVHELIIVDDDPEPTLSIEDVEADEDAGAITFTAVLDAPTGRTATVDWATSDGTAKAGEDYTESSGTIKFTRSRESPRPGGGVQSAYPGSARFEFSVPILNDDLYETGDETFKVTLSNPEHVQLPDVDLLGGVPVLGRAAEATGTIRDDDHPRVTVGFGPGPRRAAEGAAAELRVVLDRDPQRSLSIPLAATGRGGATAGDWSGVPAAVTFEAGTTEAAFALAATDDDIDDDGESVEVAFGPLPERVSADPAAATATVAIVDDDDPEVTVSFAKAAHDAAEGGEVTVTVTLSAVPERTVVIPITATGQNGATAGDWSVAPASVTFASGDTSKAFTVAAADDAVDDDGESVLLGFGDLPERVSAGTTAAAEVSIVDDDTAAVAASVSSLSVAEGGEETYTVELGSEPTAAVTVAAAVAGGGGVTAAPAALTFTASDWDSPQTVTVAAGHDDDAVDGAATVTHTAAGGGYDAVSAAVEVTVDDDDHPRVAVSFGAASYSVAESDDAATAAREDQAVVTVTLSAVPERTVEIPITATGQNGATAGDWSGVPAAVTFEAGTTEAAFALAATDDDIDDDGESVEVAFGPLPERVSADPAAATATVAIVDDDDRGVELSETRLAVAEGGTGSYTVRLRSEPTGAVTVTVTGHAGTDVAPDPESLHYTPQNWDAPQTVQVAAGQDDDSDDDTATLAHTAAGGDYTGADPAEVAVTVADDDHPRVQVGFAPGARSAAEGAAAELRVVLDRDPQRSLRIPLAATGLGGATPDDWSGVPAAVTFEAGATEAAFALAATNDDIDDDGESVEVAFGPLPERVGADPAAATATVAIDDDDDPEVTVSFAKAAHSVDEGDGVVVEVTLSAVPERTVTIPITATGQNGAAAGDWSVAPASVTFASGDTSKAFTVAADDDAVDDDGESVLLGFGALPERVSAGTTAAAEVSIVDDDTAAVAASVSSLSVAEGGEETYTVELGSEPTAAVTVAAVVGPAGADVTVEPAALTFTASDWDSPQTVTVAAGHDDDAVDGAATVTHTAAGGGYDAVSATVEVTVDDDDHPRVAVSFGAASYSVAESDDAATAAREDQAVVTVTLSAVPERTVEIPITATGQNGATAGDWSGAPTSVTFASDDTEQAFTLTAAGDDVDDDGETVLLGFGDLPERVGADPAAATATVAIDDDDDRGVELSETRLAVAEGEVGSYTVRLRSQPTGAVTVTVTGHAGTDVAPDPESLHYTPQNWDAPQTVQVAAGQDDDSDDDTATLAHTAAGGDYTGADPAEVAVTVADDDHPRVQVGFAPGARSAAEGAAAELRVVLDRDPQRSLRIPLAATGLGGATPDDWSGVPAAVTFEAGATEAAFALAATDDDIDDDGESVEVAFGPLPERVGADPAAATATVAIDDDDHPRVAVSFAKAAHSVDEGDGVVVEVTLSAVPERTVVIPITATGQNGATAGDWSVAPASVTFESGDTSKAFTVAAADDAVDDDGESVLLGFGDLPERVSAGTTAAAEVSIVDDDTAAVAASVSSLSVGEGGEETYTVELGSEPTAAVTVAAAVAGGGGVTAAPAALTFTASDWDSPQTVTVAAGHDDDAVDGAATVTHTAAGGGYDAVSAAVEVTVDDDDHPRVAVSFAKAAHSVDEGGEVTVTMTLSAVPERTVVIPITATGQNGAAAGDWSVAPASVTFASGDTSKAFTVAADDDAVDDDGESVLLGFGDLPDRVSAGTTAAAEVSIVDDDTAAVAASVSSLSVAEGGEETYTVELGSEPTAAVTVTAAVAGGGGVTAAPAALTFTASDWDSPQTVTVAAGHDDDAVDGAATVTHTAAGGGYDAVSATVEVTVDDDDHPRVAVSFGAASYSVAESDDAATAAREDQAVVTVTLSAVPERTVEIPITATGQDGATAGDWSGAPTSVTFASDDTEQAFTLTAAGDDVDDDGETVLLGFGALPERVGADPAAATATVAIDDDDDRGVELSETRLAVAEGEVGSYTVRLRSQPTGAVTVTVTGHAGTDVAPDPESLHYTPQNWDAPQTVQVAAGQDDDSDDDTATLAHTAAGGDYTGADPAEVAVTVADDDHPRVQVGFAPGARSAAEGAAAELRVVLDRDPQRSLRIPLAATGLGGATPDDWSGVPAAVTFEAGATEAAFALTATNDDIDDDGESVEVAFGPLPERVGADPAAATATVAIDDDDHPRVTVSFAKAAHRRRPRAARSP